MTNMSQEMTQMQRGGGLLSALAFSALMTFKSPKAVVNVLTYYEMSWVHSIITVLFTCACTHAHIQGHRSRAASEKE